MVLLCKEHHVEQILNCLWYTNNDVYFYIMFFRYLPKPKVNTCPHTIVQTKTLQSRVTQNPVWGTLIPRKPTLVITLMITEVLIMFLPDFVKRRIWFKRLCRSFYTKIQVVVMRFLCSPAPPILLTQFVRLLFWKLLFQAWSSPSDTGSNFAME